MPKGMNIIFKATLMLFFLNILNVQTTQPHILRHFQAEFKNLNHFYNLKQTSKSFSIAMKIFTSIQTFMNQTELNTQSELDLQFQNQSCHQLLQDIALLGNHTNWIQMYQVIHIKLQTLQSKCTNRDFQYGIQNDEKQIKDNQQVKGFNNKCALCVVILKVMENYVDYHRKDITAFVLKQFCNLFDGVIKPTCEAFVHYAGPQIIHGILNKQTADVVCLKVGFCTDPQCKITKSNIQKLQLLGRQVTPDNKPAPWDWLVHIFVDQFGNGHLPPFDLDNDTYSDISTFRGYHWRGADCNQLSNNFYPGRKKGEKILDQDCNGVFGLTGKGKTYEDEFCSHSKRFGVAVIGDSAGAHFSIPEKYFNATMINKTTYHDILQRVADELDIPSESGYTGNTRTNGYVRHSFYKYAREWNLCNHNDYQNIAVNGASSGNTQGDIKALKRSQQNDYPLIMFMELIGNDVCKDSFSRMTTEAKFKENILILLNYLDKTVPPGSHLMILGLGDGSLLYDNLHADIHPLNVTYQTVYDFLNCLKISPCWGWLNSNQTVRRFTTQRAENLSKVYQQIINQGYTFKNFDMVYYDFPAMQILERKVLEGGDPKDMIERCDGFHPNGEFHSYLADWLWFKVQTNHPEWVGPKNPYNQQIRKVFGHEVLS